MKVVLYSNLAYCEWSGEPNSVSDHVITCSRKRHRARQRAPMMTSSMTSPLSMATPQTFVNRRAVRTTAVDSRSLDVIVVFTSRHTSLTTRTCSFSDGGGDTNGRFTFSPTFMFEQLCKLAAVRVQRLIRRLGCSGFAAADWAFKLARRCAVWRRLSRLSFRLHNQQI